MKNIVLEIKDFRGLSTINFSMVFKSRRKFQAIFNASQVQLKKKLRMSALVSETIYFRRI
jgi:hypothetical protein